MKASIFTLFIFLISSVSFAGIEDALTLLGNDDGNFTVLCSNYTVEEITQLDLRENNLCPYLPKAQYRTPYQYIESIVRSLNRTFHVICKSGELFSGLSGDQILDANVCGRKKSVSETSTMLSAGGMHTCLLTDKGVQCWGRNDTGQIDVPDDLIHTRQISLGVFHTCASTDEGVRCWGYN